MKTSKLVAISSVIAELVVAVSVVGIFAGVLFPVYISVHHQAKQAAATLIAARSSAPAERHPDCIASAKPGE